MVPIAGMDIYERLRCLNSWTQQFLPNAAGLPPLAKPAANHRWSLQPLAEWPLRGAVGDHLETWERQRKASRFRRQAGHELETRFDADICQGNFHHHGARTRQELKRRLTELGIGMSLLEPPANLD